MSTLPVFPCVPTTPVPRSRIHHFYTCCRDDLRLHALALAAVCGLGVSTTSRLALFVVFARPSGASWWLCLPTLLVGLCNDLVNILAVLFPFVVSLWVLSPAFHRSAMGRLLLAVQLWLGLFVVLFLAVVEFFFFKEFNARFNLVAVDYLIYPHEVFGNIVESYHVVPVLLIVAIVAATPLIAAWRWIMEEGVPQQGMLRRLTWMMGYVAVLALLMTLFSTHSLDFSTNRIVNEISANGVSSFFEALHTNHLDYPALYRTVEPHRSAELLQRQLATDTSRTLSDDSLHRISTGSSLGLGKLNVVVIVEESFGCEQVDACGAGASVDQAVASTLFPLTPSLNALAKQGLFFTRAYATGTRTVRGLEAITASFPPIPSESIVKRPGNEHLATWGSVMRDNGYHTSFLYGGYSQFDNMGAFYRSNGYSVSDRLDIDHPRFTNIWGVCDQDLFDHARAYFDQRAASGQPFFSVIMTTSNHSPYTFPVGVDGVRPHGGGRRDGVRYADFALGEFFDKSKSASWFNDTLFVVVADHGARVYGSQQFPLASYQIPLLLLATGHLKAGEATMPISQIDIAPTVLGLLGLPYTAPFFGQNAFAEADSDRVLLLNHNHDVALFKQGKLAVLGLRNAAATYDCKLDTAQLHLVVKDEHLLDLGAAYYQSAFDMFMHHTYR